MEQDYKGVGISGVMADMPRPMMRMTTRYEYMKNYLLGYKVMIRYRFYAIVGLILGIYLLFIVPILAVLVLFLATYFYQQHLAQKDRIFSSTRKVMIGQ
ncbi:MAG: hypothetical protein ABH803_00730 [Candidatus Micrarchaeota archaeon]